jgi:hypothetical protein
MLVFSTQLCEILLLSNLLPGLPGPLLSSFPKYKYCRYRQFVAGRGWGEGVKLCWRPYSAGVQLYVSDQIHNVQNIYTTLFAKNQGGEGASDRLTPVAKFLYRSTFLNDI